MAAKPKPSFLLVSIVSERDLAAAGFVVAGAPQEQIARHLIAIHQADRLKWQDGEPATRCSNPRGTYVDDMGPSFALVAWDHPARIYGLWRQEARPRPPEKLPRIPKGTIP